MCKTENLLEYNVREGWGPLCKFLGKEEPKQMDFPHVNKNGEINHDNLGMENLAALKRSLINQLITGLSMKFLLVLLLIGVFFMM